MVVVGTIVFLAIENLRGVQGGESGTLVFWRGETFQGSSSPVYVGGIGKGCCETKFIFKETTWKLAPNKGKNN